MNPESSRLVQPIKVLVTLVLLAWLGKLLYQSDVQQYLSNVGFALVLAACAVHLVAYGFLFVRWRNILAIFYRLPYLQLVDSYYIGLFSNNFIPTTVGGDLVRVSYLYRQGLQPGRLLLCAVIDRLLGLLATLAIAIASTLLFSSSRLMFELDPELMFLIGVATMTILAAGFLLLVVIAVQAELKRKVSLFFSKVLNQVRQLATAVRGQTQRLLLGALLSLAGTIVVVLCYYVLAQALMLSIPLAVLLFVVPVSYVPAALPISVGGLGVREGSIVFLLTLFDVPVEQGLALTATYLLVLILVTAPGGVLILRTARPSLIKENNTDL